MHARDQHGGVRAQLRGYELALTRNHLRNVGLVHQHVQQLREEKNAVFEKKHIFTQKKLLHYLLRPSLLHDSARRLQHAHQLLLEQLARVCARECAAILERTRHRHTILLTAQLHRVIGDFAAGVILKLHLGTRKLRAQQQAQHLYNNKYAIS